MQSTGVPLRVCMLGSGNVGKSALTLQFMYDEFVEDYEPTKCSAYKKQMNLDGYMVNLDITDTAATLVITLNSTEKPRKMLINIKGQEDYVGIQDQYYRFNDGFLVVFSLCDMETLKSVPAILERIVQCRTPERIPIVLVGNKADLVHERTVPYETAKLLADQWQIPYMETSAKTRFNLENTYGILIRALLHNKLGACRQPTEQVSSGGSGCCVVL
ncbi:Ras protein Ral-A [Fasciolopsis buskii]|uniref:Ras protein Ral-A n=1 Tax=Fasciolopsis buskii TaxID=27845 RepID=A0A8E0RY04_9TREM|nr:Ras protein Ral-A [Fasciolopsis buski]